MITPGFSSPTTQVKTRQAPLDNPKHLQTGEFYALHTQIDILRININLWKTGIARTKAKPSRDIDHSKYM